MNKKEVKLTENDLFIFYKLNDKSYWMRLNNYCISTSRLSSLRIYRTKKIIPGHKTLDKYIDDDKVIEQDTREKHIILKELLTPFKDLPKKIKNKYKNL